MKLYSAAATSDWGTICSDEKIKAGKWSTAFNRAGYLAQVRCRKRPKRIAISLVLIGTIKATPPEVA
jgi:hypothetical protein